MHILAKTPVSTPWHCDAWWMRITSQSPRTPAAFPPLVKALCARMGEPMNSSPTAHGATHMPHASEEWAMASALPWDLLPGLNHWGMGVGEEDPTAPKLTTGMGPGAQLFPETHPWGMESGSGTGRWGGCLPVLLLGVWWGTLSCCQAAPLPPHHPFPQIRLCTEADYSAP